MSAYIGKEPTFNSLVTQELTGNGTVGPYSLLASPGTAGGILVIVGGVTQRAFTDYTVNGAAITFTTAILSGISIYIVFLGKEAATGVPAGGSVAYTSLNATLQGLVDHMLLDNVTDVLTKGFAITKATLTDAAAVTPDLTQSNCFNWNHVTANGAARTLNFPSTVPSTGGVWYVDVTNDGATTYTLSLAAGYSLMPGNTFDGTPNKINRLWLIIRSLTVIDVYIDQVN